MLPKCLVSEFFFDPRFTKVVKNAHFDDLALVTRRHIDVQSGLSKTRLVLIYRQLEND